MEFKKALFISLLVALVGAVIIVLVFIKTGIIDLPTEEELQAEITMQNIDLYNSELSSGSCDNGVPSDFIYWHDTKVAAKGFGEIYELDINTELGTKFVEGDSFAFTPKTGDIFYNDDYMYVYNMKASSSGVWVVDEKLSGWGVRRTSMNKKSDYTSDTLLSSINKKPVVCASYAFYNAKLMPKTITIPATIIDVTGMFENTRSLNIKITLNSTPTQYENCFKDSNGFYVTDDGMFCDYNPNAIVYLSGNCDDNVKQKLAETSEFENIVIK